MKAQRIVKWGFEMSPKENEFMINITLEGKRKCYIEALIAYEKHNYVFPQVGDMQLMMGQDGKKVALIGVRKVRLIRFNEFDQQTLDLINEPFEIEMWKSYMEKELKKQCELMGVVYQEDIMLVVVEFDLIEKYNK